MDLEFVKGYPITRALFAIVYLTTALVVGLTQLFFNICLRSWNARLYRKINKYLAYMTHCHFTFLINWWSNSEYDLFTDPDYLVKYLGKEHAFTIVNHGKDIEGLLNWPVAEYFGVLGNYRAFLKSALKFVPIYGLNWIMEEQVFLQRNWEKDKIKLESQLNNLTDYPDTMWLCILPEGTRLSQEKLEASRRIAREKGLVELNHVLLPRTKGFIATINYFRGRVPAVYDFTVVICNESEKDASFAGLFSGKKIRYKIMLKRYPLDELPENEKDLGMWLHQRYQEKDKLLENIYSKGEFEPEEDSASTEEMKRLNSNFVYVKIPKTKSSLWTVVCSAVVVLGFLIGYMTVILLNGKFIQFGFIIAAIFAACAGLEKALDISVTSNSSSYGKS